MSDSTATVSVPAEIPAPQPIDLSKTPTLTAALVKAIAETPWVEYTKPSGGGINYEYLAEEDITKALRKTLPANGITVIPVKMTLVANETYNSDKGGRMVNRLICVRYRISHTSGEFVEGEAMGEGSDRGDKAINKAMTGAYKYFLREVTQIAGGLDPDKTSSDELARAAKVKGAAPTPQSRTGQQQKPAQTEKPLAERAKDAKTLVSKAATHDAIRKIATHVADVFKAEPKLRDEIFRTCAARATVLFVGDIGKADDLETVEKILKTAERDKIGDENMNKVRAAADDRNRAIAGTPDDQSGEGGDDAPVAIEF